MIMAFFSVYRSPLKEELNIKKKRKKEDIFDNYKH